MQKRADEPYPMNYATFPVSGPSGTGDVMVIMPPTENHSSACRYHSVPTRGLCGPWGRLDTRGQAVTPRHWWRDWGGDWESEGERCEERGDERVRGRKRERERDGTLKGKERHWKVDRETLNGREGLWNLFRVYYSFPLEIRHIKDKSKKQMLEMWKCCPFERADEL